MPYLLRLPYRRNTVGTVGTYGMHATEATLHDCQPLASSSFSPASEQVGTGLRSLWPRERGSTRGVELVLERAVD